MHTSTKRNTSSGTAPQCTTGCGKPATGMCSTCWTTLAAALAHLWHDGQPGWLLAELDLALTKQVRFGRAQLGVVSRLSERPLVVNLAASDVQHELRATLGQWTRRVHLEHAPRWQQCDVCGAEDFTGRLTHDVRAPRLCPGNWAGRIDPLTDDRATWTAAGWLLRHPSWIRAHTQAGQMHREIVSLVGRAVALIDRPADQSYLGICSAPVQTEDGQDVEECPVPLYAQVGATSVRCWWCGSVHVVADRQKVLGRAVENELVPVGTLVGLVGELGTVLTTSVIRGMKHRGQLHPKVRDDLTGSIRLRVEDDLGPDLFRVGDVLDLLPRLRKPRVSKGHRKQDLSLGEATP